jgi:uracil phosphoribosyltransferase
MWGIEQPARERVVDDPRLTIVSNAVTEPLLARLRDNATGAAAFTATAEQLARYLLYEAGRDLALQPWTVTGFDGRPITVQRLAARVGGVVILRAGLAFAPTFRELFPDCPLHQVGLRRDEETLAPSIYANNLPARPGWADVVLLLDPMLATGGSARAAIDLLRASHIGEVIVVSFVAAPYGVEAVLRHEAGCRIVTLALDDRLNDAGFILPGLGDAGDRLFGTL